MFKRIPCDWFLSDGILPAVRLETPETVAKALRHAGLLEKRGAIMDALKDEWIYRRQWRYSAVFSAEGSTRRRHLSVTGLCGDWTLRLNGKTLASGRAPSAEVEIPDPLTAGENRVEISFAAPDCAVIAPELGFRGAISLRETGCAVIRSLRAQGSPAEGYRLLADIDADDEHPCQLRFGLRSRGKNIENTLPATLARGAQLLSLTPFEADAWPRGERAIVTLSVLVDDVSSDETTLSLYLPADSLIPRGFAAGDEFAAATCATAGGNVLCARTEAAVLAADHHLALTEPGTAAASALSALTREKLLLRLTNNDLDALNDSAVWMLTDSDLSAFRETQRQYLAPDTAWPDASRLSRYYQAVDLRRRAEDARLSGEAFIVKDACDITPRCASRALFDSDSCPRPAYGALSDAWKKDHAFVRPPQAFPEDGIVNVPIYYVTDGDPAGVIITAVALRQDGQELVSATFPAAGRADGLVGRLCTEMPDDGLLILRTRVMKNGQCVSVSDDIVFRQIEDLSSLRQTQLIWDGDMLKNAGSTVAVGVSVPGARFFGALLPDETVTLTVRGVKFAEALNTFE